MENQDEDENAIADEKLPTSQNKNMQNTLIKQASQHPLATKFDNNQSRLIYLETEHLKPHLDRIEMQESPHARQGLDDDDPDLPHFQDILAGQQSGQVSYGASEINTPIKLIEREDPLNLKYESQ